jgi:hypothetical protein
MHKRTTARSFLFRNVHIPFTYTIECSFGLSSKGVLNVPEFREIGRDAAVSVLAFLDVVKRDQHILEPVLPPQEPSESD